MTKNNLDGLVEKILIRYGHYHDIMHHELVALIDQQTNEAYKKGRIDEAKVCEETRRHDTALENTTKRKEDNL